jgi:hypothetical protein
VFLAGTEQPAEKGMKMNIYDYLCAELETVNNELFKPFHNMETCNHCRYWQGYADALTNALNELAGPGDVN